MTTLNASNDVHDLAHLLSGVAEFCRASGASDSAAARLQLVVEELFVNFATHAATPDDAPPRFVVSLERIGGGVICTIRDNAEPFDPRVEGGAPTDGSADARPVGGLGLKLIRRLASRLEYDVGDGVNTTRITLED